MRLHIVEDTFGARQYVTKHEDKDFDFIDFSQKGGWNGVLEWINEERITPIYSIDSDLYAFVFIKISENEGGFFIKAHHTIVDAWTMILIGNQISDYYLKKKEGKAPEIHQLPSYLDYIESEIDYEKSPEFTQSKAFWVNKFKTIPELTTLSPNKTMFASCEASRKIFTLSKELTTNLNQYSKDSGVSVFVLLLSILTIYLHRVLEKNDIVVGTPLLNRSTIKEKMTIGMFIETIPIRLQIDDNLDFETFALRATDEWKQMRKHRYPYNLLLEEIRKKQKLTTNLYDIMIDYQNVKFDLGQSFKPRPYFSGSESNSICLHISDRENIGQLNFDIDYQVDLFSEFEIESIYSNLITLLEDALKTPTKKIYQLELLKDQEKDYIINKLNLTFSDFERDKTIYNLFEEQVEKTPDNIAVIYEDKKITYKELNSSANRLARVLIKKGIKTGNIVALLIDRSIEMAASILAILKAGAAYLPLDPNYPLNRINFILQDSNAKLLLTQNHLLNNTIDCPVLNLDNFLNYQLDDLNLDNVNKPSDLAYVIYTSGSTGKPKGVMIEHKSVCNFFSAMAQQVDLTDKIVLSVTTICFDIFAFELLLPLVNGLTIVIANEEQQLVPMALSSLIIDHGINIIQTTPSRMNLLLMDENSHKALENVTDIILGGEAFPEKLLKKLKRITSARIFNGYGPTEATIYSTFKELTNNNFITIGKPVANTKTYILDKNLLPVPINIPGELFIGGEGLARGYLNRSELTKERFLPNPFETGERIYRTGDLAKWTSEGEIDFLGRVDFQVKIRGYRIELGEIENTLCDHNQILDAAVIDQEAENGDKYLCAYLIAKASTSSAELRQFLSKTLPDYMIPSSFVFLEEMPLNSNGKVCRNTLKQSHLPVVESSVPFVESRNEVDSILIKKWSKVLNINKLGIDDSFFDLGGDSLKIVRLLVLLLPLNWELTARDFYKYQTIRCLSDKIRGVSEDENWHEDSRNDIASIYSKHNIADIKFSGKLIKMTNVLLTGATGYLGAHLLKELFISTNSQIYCIVRGSSLEKATKKLSKSLDFFFPDEFKNEIGRRIKIVHADLALDCFGLSTTQYEKLGKSVDTVIHSAAKVRHYGGYSDFEMVNVFGTKRVIDFCLTFGQKLHYISSTSVSGRYLVKQNLGDTVFTENDFFIGQHYYENVYVRSKFEAENKILTAMKEGLNATIYRVGMLSGRYSDGHFQLNIEDNGLYNRMKSVTLLGAIPEEFYKQELEYTPVDYCSRAILLLANLAENKNKVFHIFNHKTVFVSHFVTAAKLCGFNIEIKDKDSFSDHLKKTFSDPTQTEALTGIINDINLTRTIGLQDSPFIESEITCKYLKLLGFEWPVIDLPYLTKVITYMESIHFLTKKTNTGKSDHLIVS